MASHNGNGFETSLNKDGHKHFPSMKKNKDYTKIYQSDDSTPADKKNEIFRFGIPKIFCTKLTFQRRGENWDH
jgi:hypothetical protein